jgi:hypothetical protein
MNLFTRKAASVAALTVLGLTAGGIAWAESSSVPAPPAAAAAVDGTTAADLTGAATPDAAAKARMHGLGRRMLHGEFVMQTRNGFVTAVIARGTVASIDANSISVTSADGVATTFTVDAKTKARSAGAVVPIGSVHQGDKVGVLGIKTGNAAVAKLIRKLPASANNT